MFVAGYGPYLINEVHDEIDGMLPLQAVRVHVPKIEEIVIRSAKELLPDIRVTVETTLSKYWDKNGVVFEKLEYDQNGVPIIPIPEYILDIKKGK